MQRSTPWCNPSATFRLEWRPSRWVVGALLALSVLAPFAVLQSEMPRAWAWPLAAAAAAYGLWRARREARKPTRSVDWPIDGAKVEWRGPLLFVRAPGLTLAWWPDTLDPATSSELRRNQ